MKRIDEKLQHLKAEQEAGRCTLCPRCGRDNMFPKHTRALSRLADIMICERCGIDEAKLAFMQTPGTLYTWVGLQPDRPESDFRALPGKEVWERICREQVSKIMRLYERYTNGDSPEEIRLCAFESCPGLTEMWTEPYRMDYRAADGTVVIRFRNTENGTEMTGAMIKGGDVK